MSGTSNPPPAKLKMPPKAVSEAIIRRFLKPDQTIYWAREIPKWYSLYKQYPSVAFWQVYELPFGNGSLNHMSWFDGVEGKVELERAFLLWSYNPPPLPPLDAAPKAADTEGESEPLLPPPRAGPRRARTVADMFRSL